ncbi:tigger transposable element-derived protein 1-like [Palaemon carinicauda]|uniref:tigger transposable element-derived protein 1-like n=1 Tax=Palaemon carinicauda TaxID=392227 RepID=UPI0035B5DC8E
MNMDSNHVVRDSSIRLKPRRSRHVLSLLEKVKILDLIEKDHLSYMDVARKYGKNESSIRGIFRKRHIIRASCATAPASAKVTTTLGGRVMIRTEKALKVWIEDMAKEGFTIDSHMLRKKALSLHEEFATSERDKGTTEEIKPFKASKGWLEKFKARHHLKNLPEGEGDFSDEATVEGTHYTELKEIVREGGYDPRQVFSCDEAGLFWKRMPNGTYIHKLSKRVLGIKDWKDRLSLVLCSNAAGHTIIPGVVYHMENPPPLKDKVKTSLPVYWQHNAKAWVTASLFKQWFHQCFIPEVEAYLGREGLPFKVLLIIDNAPCHPQEIVIENEHVHVEFLPSDVSPSVQPLYQGIQWCIKASYTRQVFEMIKMSVCADPDISVMETWREFTIADAITFIRLAVDELRPETVNACWRNLWSEVVEDFKGFPQINDNIRKILSIARLLGGYEMVNMKEEDIVMHIEEHEEWANVEGEDMVTLPKEEDEEFEEAEPQNWTLEKLSEVFSLCKDLKDKINEYDPHMQRSIKVNRGLTDAMSPLQQAYDKMKRQNQQLHITTFFPNRSLPVITPKQQKTVTTFLPKQPLPVMFSPTNVTSTRENEGDVHWEEERNGSGSVTMDQGYSTEELEAEESMKIKEEPVDLDEESLCAEEENNQNYFRSNSEEEALEYLKIEIKDEPIYPEEEIFQ